VGLRPSRRSRTRGAAAERRRRPSWTDVTSVLAPQTPGIFDLEFASPTAGTFVARRTFGGPIAVSSDDGGLTWPDGISRSERAHGVEPTGSPHGRRRSRYWCAMAMGSRSSASICPMSLPSC
jgi:hypothetical protein